MQHADKPLKHKRHAALSDLDRLQLGVGRLFVRDGVRAVSAHAVVQTGARGLEAAAGLCVVLALDQAHELAHVVAVVPRRAERVLGDEPARREDDKVGHGGAESVARRRQNSEDGGIRMVKGD